MFEASKGRLKVVGRAGVGIDNVDLQAATEVSLDHANYTCLLSADAAFLMGCLAGKACMFLVLVLQFI